MLNLIAAAVLAAPMWGGQIRHGDDTGYDAAILVRCDANRPSTNRLVSEGHVSDEYCNGDTDRVYVRRGEEVWCYSPRTFAPYKQWDATGWHDIPNWFDRTCTLRVD